MRINRDVVLRQQTPAYRPVGEVTIMYGAIEKQHVLRAQLAQWQRRGVIGQVWDEQHDLLNGVISYKVERLRDPRPRWQTTTGVVAGVALGLTGVAWLLWESRYVIAAVVAALAAVALLCGIFAAFAGGAGSGGGCGIVHRPGCGCGA